MSNDIEKVDLQSASEKLKEKIQLAFVDLLTPEQWTAMIAAELKEFTVGKEVRDHYSGRVTRSPSTLANLCEPIFKATITEKLKEHFADVDAREEIKAATTRWLQENAQQMLANAIILLISEAMGKALENHLSDAFYSLRNMGS